MVARQVPWILVGVMLVVAGCARSRVAPRSNDVAVTIGDRSSSIPVRLDRGDWMVDKRTTVWKVEEARVDGPRRRLGYLVKTQYRQLRGGPDYDIYEVTTLNRREKIGHIDQVGRAYRYQPRRNQGFDQIDVGIGSLENSVGAIFQTSRAITLVETNERELAFEAIDKDGNGLLDAEETKLLGDRIPGADSNGDGKVDLQEFAAIDQL